MKVAIMQPYYFPYLGYFQLIYAVDTFVFYDDVNFIKKGFINKNFVLGNSEKLSFTVPCQKISQNKKINETSLEYGSTERGKFLKMIHHNYQKAPYFDIVFKLISDFLESFDKQYISQLAVESVQLISEYLNIETQFQLSSEKFSDSVELKKEQRLIKICKDLKCKEYINPFGGIELYKKSDFLKAGITLKFLKPDPIHYNQFNNEFVPWLSIIDVLMFNSISEVRSYLNRCHFI